MLPNLCRHCAKHHLSKQQPPNRYKEPPEGLTSMWLPTNTRKKLSKFRDNVSGRDVSATSNENAASNAMNELAHDSSSDTTIDQLVQFNNSNILPTKSQLIQSSDSIRNGVSVQATESSKMNGLNNDDDVHTSCSNGALSGQPQAMQSFENLLTPSIATASIRCNECRCVSAKNGDDVAAASGRKRSFSSNVHTTTNPSSFSENKNRLATDCGANRISDPKANPHGSNRSVRTVSANYSRKHATQYAFRWPYAISSTMNFSHVLLICIAVIVFGTRHALVFADDTPSTALQLNVTETGICSSKDIRNSVKSFNELKDCRVIEGFLMITLIDKYNDTDYDGVEFPNLTEVTEFVLVYRVNGLRSLGKLFPNLRVIRGNTLIHDFSFVVFEMMHLQEIGLKSLVKISRGSVRIEKNPALCFVDTIDWSLIASGSKENVISNNKPLNECPTCPGPFKNDLANDQMKPVDPGCPESVEMKRRVCWNRQQCQQVCPKICGNSTCNINGQCCNASCIGCAADDPHKCLSCRDFSIGNFPNQQCVEKCPSKFFAHEQRRCVTEDGCRAIKKPVFVKFDFNLLEKPYIPREGECSINCPSNYYPDGPSGMRECHKCEGSCKKECPAGSIDSISTAQRYRGCTHIKGSFVINIRNQGGHNIVRELETFLSDIEVIEGNLSIVRSYPLLSLNFFKKLRIIKGTTDSKDRFGLRVLENQNLQALFAQNVTIETGRMFFHFNPKLCMNVIESFKDNVVELRNVPFRSIPVDEIAPLSNGDKTACNVTTLEVVITAIKSNVVIMTLTPLSYEDDRQLLGYLLYYMPAPYQNVTMFEGRDACGSDGWQVDDVPDNNRNNTPVTILATHLKPYTQYAYYIRTYTVASEQRGGISPIKYFRTLPDKPDPVTKLGVEVDGSSKVKIRWGPPVHAHGNLTMYVIKATMIADDIQLLEQRDYCSEPPGNEPLKIPTAISTKPVPKETKDPTYDTGCSCEGEEGRERSKFSDADVEQLIEFEDELHNTVYVRQETVRSRRDVSHEDAPETLTQYISKVSRRQKRTSNTTISAQDIFPANTPQPSPMIPVEDKESKWDITHTYYTYFYKEVNASVFALTLTDLKHFTYYSISVKACREGDGDNCGTEMIAYQRTGKIESADDVTDVIVEKLKNQTTGVKLSWTSGDRPNGIIVSYYIRYQRVDIDFAKYQEICIPYNVYYTQGKQHTIVDLVNGNYSFTVMANSLAGPNTRWSSPVYYNVYEPTITPLMIALIVILIIAIISGVGFLAWYYRRKFGEIDNGLKLIASVNPEYVSMQYYPDEWEVPRENIIQMRELGQGSFGMVYEGIIKNLRNREADTPCAIKTVNENATDRERINFLKEAAVMKAFDTYHVVHLLGVVSIGQPVLVVMELMLNGDLKGYLRSHRPESGADVVPPTLRRTLQMAIEIADGMAYLAAKKFVHRDLAARNCMVAEDLTVKIGDFGMTRDIYETDYYRKGTKGLLPVRWMAPESLKDGVFSTSSDVFSFGIVLWEMSTLASQPYQGLSNDQVLRYVIDGGVMERPENCPEKMYTLMCRTWQHRPSARPTFMQIITLLLEDAPDDFKEVSFYYTPAGQELLSFPQHQTPNIPDIRTPVRAEEENFSVGIDVEDDDGPEDPNSYLMQKHNSSQPSASGSGPSNSPLRVANSSKLPDVALSKQVPKNSSHPFKMPSLSKTSHQPLIPFISTLLPLHKPATNESDQTSHSLCNDSNAALLPVNDSTPVTGLLGRNGIKSNLNQMALIKFGDGADTTGEHSNNDYCNTSSTVLVMPKPINY